MGRDHYNVGDRLKGEAIGMSARKIDPITVSGRSGRHKAQYTTGHREAVAWIDRPLKSVRDVQNRDQ